MTRLDPTLCVIIYQDRLLPSDDEKGVQRAACALALEAARGGASLVQLRDKRSDLSAVAALARAIQDVLRSSDSPASLIVNDHVDVAREVGAGGVHLGQQDMNARRARERLGPHALIGLSVGTLGELLAAPVDVLDYVAVGPVFPTMTKADAGPALQPERLRSFRAQCALPLMAIGGIDATNVARVVAAGVDGIAASAAVMGAPDPRRACERLRVVLERARKAMEHDQSS